MSESMIIHILILSKAGLKFIIKRDRIAVNLKGVLSGSVSTIKYCQIAPKLLTIRCRNGA